MPKISGAGSRVLNAALGSPALGTTNAVLGDTAMANGATTLVTAGITAPDVARNLTVTGNASTVAGNVVIAGTNNAGEAISETIVAAGTATIVGNKAFATVTSITLPAYASAGTERIRVGTGAKLGLPVSNSRDAVVSAFLAGVREATRPTVTFSASARESNTIALSSALNGSAVLVDYYETN
ncbi:hypothetical protein [Novosphingobium huizhouense]|uniref:hypothetical protein n=1 Tax=Novosphingobium huizhouense TaxID=2866625 RepID=UPI001CD89CBF|nr:hypothetical protein [Novosphingobium huizhouense]